MSPRCSRPATGPSRALPAVLLSLGLAAGLLAGCSAEESAPAGLDGHRGQAGQAGQGATSGSPRTYVALGDSYTAAPLVGRLASDSRCLRSAANYPHLLAERLDLELTDASCGGATTAHLTEPQQLPGEVHPPQGDALGPDTDLVTLSLGANDNNFFAGVLSCTRHALSDPEGTPCQDAFDVGPGDDSLLDKSERLLTDNVAWAVRQVRDRAPDARILVVGYPHVAPTDSGCEQFPIADGDVGFVHELNLLLNRSLAAAAAREDVEYVDVYAATRGHDMCAADAWIAGREPTAQAAPYHPYAAEQRAVAKLLEQVLAD